MELPQEKLFDLYEQIVVELIELREFPLAQEMLRRTRSLLLLRTESPARYEAQCGGCAVAVRV